MNDDSKKSSFEATHPNEADGKIANLLFLPNDVEPSLLTVNDAKYYSIISNSILVISETLLLTE